MASKEINTILVSDPLGGREYWVNKNGSRVMVASENRMKANDRSGISFKAILEKVEMLPPATAVIRMHSSAPVDCETVLFFAINTLKIHYQWTP